ncbi:MAG TPA: dienelactone hydrolase family protein [Vicinamibacterales bacterium]|jgi:carboxymethylenebutenolidase|nr:dienelactone hydrolase family protein [Vicinamibacterales bacterium]
MKRVALFVAAMAIAAPVLAQQPGARGGGQAPAIDVPWNDAIPPGTVDHATRALKESPRHGEWVDIKMADGTALKSWVVYPERADKAGVVLVIHDIFGMRDLARALGDQLAQDGFIAIVPDFLSGKGPNGGGAESLGTGVNQAISSLSPADVVARLNAAMEYGRKLPSSNGKTGVVGFCWGGSQSFNYAAAQPNLDAAVVFYGQAPGTSTNDATADSVATSLANLKAPVLGMYAGNDNRIDSTIPVTEAAMKKLGKPYETHVFEGAGHGFVFAQAGQNGANLKATQDAWPLVLQFYRAHLQ